MSALASARNFGFFSRPLSNETRQNDVRKRTSSRFSPQCMAAMQFELLSSAPDMNLMKFWVNTYLIARTNRYPSLKIVDHLDYYSHPRALKMQYTYVRCLLMAIKRHTYICTITSSFLNIRIPAIKRESSVSQDRKLNIYEFVSSHFRPAAI